MDVIKLNNEVYFVQTWMLLWAEHVAQMENEHLDEGLNVKITNLNDLGYDGWGGRVAVA